MAKSTKQKTPRAKKEKGIESVLGQTVDYPDQYDPKILVREARQTNRTPLGIKDDDLPFVGYDVWNAYEASTLTKNGLPVSGSLKIVYPAFSKYIVESKSLKLYLNSFNMTRLASSVKETIYMFKHMVAGDLSRLLEADVRVEFFSYRDVLGASQSYMQGLYNNFYNLETGYEIAEEVFDVFKEDPSLLEPNDSDEEENYGVQRFHSSLLKSNCKVTSQPDWGDVFIKIKSEFDVLCGIPLLKYLVSFRDECHFHEEITETIYKRLYDRFQIGEDPSNELTVLCLYTRRGGIDICPIRSNRIQDITNDFTNVHKAYVKTPKQ